MNNELLKLTNELIIANEQAERNPTPALFRKQMELQNRINFLRSQKLNQSRF